MRFRVAKDYVWFGTIPDCTGALAQKLAALHAGGLDLEMILARRDWSGVGFLFVSPLRTEEEIQAAQQAGLSIADSFQAVRVEGPNVRGIAARITTALAQAGLSIRGYWAAALGDQHVTNIAFDSREDVDRAVEVLTRTLADDAA